MRLHDHEYQRALFPTALFLLVCVLSGCAMVGPSSISRGRSDYSEAINRTEDEQLLMSIVKGRYGETFTFLTVTGVAANVRFKTNAGANVGFGPNKSYAGNLVPLSAGLAYEENPTITYSPLESDKFAREVMTPIPLDSLLVAIRSLTQGGDLFAMYVERINNLRNPDFFNPIMSESSSRFMSFVELFKELYTAGVLDLVRDSRKEIEFNLVIESYAPQYAQKVRDFFTLLDLTMPTDDAKDLLIPIYFGVKIGSFWGISIRTRSTMDLVEILEASVEVPQEHVRAGLTIHYPPMGLPGKDIRIISSTERPNGMSLAVKYRGYWFYIDETDQCTKGFFRTLRWFWSVSISESVDKSAAPVLTIPVGQ